MNIPRNDSKVRRLSASMRDRESVLGRWRSESTHKIEAARELNVSFALQQLNDWLGGSMRHVGSDYLRAWSRTGGHNEKYWSQMNIS